MADNQIIKFSELKSHCQSCSLYDLCLPMGLESSDINRLGSVIKRSKSVRKNEFLFRLGEPLKSIFAIRSGSFKTYLTNPDGTEQIVGFSLPGELLGMDAISDERHTCTTKALETSSVCEIPFERLETLARDIPGLQHQLLRLMSKEIQQDQNLMLLLAQMPAETRLASFLLGMSERLNLRGYAANEFNLSMSRGDIANLLGMAVETISRLLSHFQDDGLLKVERKHITILKLDDLRKLTTHCASHCPNSSQAN
ncbi:MAG: fumarate/nitrate reduction transcriptional regulator Fnr [Gammaproteobacteria bacterium]|nr:fumarate/nitrate reduction transcriptional regulator Fnr [Gammaproteobacteria bacterium]